PRAWARRFEAEIADNDACLVHQHAGPLFQLRYRNSWIDVAVIIRPAYHNVCRLLADVAEKSADAIGRRGHFFDDFLELLDRLPRFDKDSFALGNFHAQIEQFAPHGIAGRERRDQKINAIEQIEFPFSPVPLVTHPFFTRLDYTMREIVRQSPQSPPPEALNGPRLFNSRNRSLLRGQLARCDKI